jgi:hypothetical protein
LLGGFFGLITGMLETKGISGVVFTGVIGFVGGSLMSFFGLRCRQGTTEKQPLDPMRAGFGIGGFALGLIYSRKICPTKAPLKFLMFTSLIGWHGVSFGKELPLYKKAIAVVVGISTYEHSSEDCETEADKKNGWDRLPNATVDVRNFAQKMRELGIEVIDLYDHQAGGEGIRKALENAGNKLVDAIETRDDQQNRLLLIFYFAGHGFEPFSCKS